jgi:hypothetical protein
MMNAQKTLIVATEASPGGSSHAFLVFRKRVGVAYSSSDVANLAFEYHQILAGGSTAWEYGAGSSDASGNITIASVTTPTGPGSLPPASDTINVSPVGLVTLTNDASFHGFMTPDKKAIFGVQTRAGSIPSAAFSTLLVTGQTFTQADLTGVYEFHALTSGTNLAASSWVYGRVSIGNTGTVTSRYALSPAGASLPAIGPLTLAGDGTVTSSTNATYHGRMSWGKDVYVRTQTASGANSLSLAVK